MRLTDRIQVIEATVTTDRYGNLVEDWTNPTVTADLPAEVVFTSVALNTEGGMRTQLVEQLRAITEPFDYTPGTQRIRWRGEDYTNDGPAMIRRRGGRDHHQTLPLTRVTG